MGTTLLLTLSATLDGLGVLGAGGHTLQGHLLVHSLLTRGRLPAGLPATATGG